MSDHSFTPCSEKVIVAVSLKDDRNTTLLMKTNRVAELDVVRSISVIHQVDGDDDLTQARAASEGNGRCTR